MTELNQGGQEPRLSQGASVTETPEEREREAQRLAARNSSRTPEAGGPAAQGTAPAEVKVPERSATVAGRANDAERANADGGPAAQEPPPIGVYETPVMQHVREQEREANANRQEDAAWTDERAAARGIAAQAWHELDKATWGRREAIAPEYREEERQALREELGDRGAKAPNLTQEEASREARVFMEQKVAQERAEAINQLEPLNLDAATLDRLAARRDKEMADARAAMGLGESENSDRMAQRLDAQMANAQLEERGWRDREDITDLMRDLEVLASKDWNRAAELWDKYRPNDVDKPVFIDGDDVDRPDGKGKRSQSEETAKDARSDEEDDNKFVTPESIRKKFIEAQGKYHFRGEENRLAFEDTGRKLKTEHNDPDVAVAMIELAQAKNWTSIKVKGAEEFERRIWLEGSLRGIEVEGYKPRDLDIAKLEELRRDRGLNSKGVPENSIEQMRERDRASERAAQRAGTAVDGRVVDEQREGLRDNERQAIRALQTILRQRGDSEQAVEMATQMATERFNSSRVYVGQVIEHGAAPYGNKKENELSYYVKLQTQSGERVVWGVDLKRAVEESGVQAGDDVALANKGRQPVAVRVKDRDAEGKVVGERDVTTHRNAWDVNRLDRLREEARAKLEGASKVADKQPLVKVYDRDAPRETQRQVQAPTREVDRGREAERARG